MTLIASTSPNATFAGGSHLAAPTWVLDLLAGGTERIDRADDGVKVRVREAGDLSLVSVTVPWARALPAGEIERLTADNYQRVQRILQAGPAQNPVRIWNHIPDIHAPGADGIDRYMAFNAGRFHAYSQWLGGAGAFDQTVPSASAVGHDGTELVIHALGSRSPGIAIANPRQVAPHRYSRRFGPLPPCFARATLLPASNGTPNRLLVGGTASIRGEESTHPGDIREQNSETFHNLAHLVRAASHSATPHVNGMTSAEVRKWLSHFRNLRVYYLNEADRPYIQSRVREDFATDCAVEYVRATLCRSELLVEIEGLSLQG